MTISAVARLIPNPPDLVLSMKMNLELFGMLKSLIYFWRIKNTVFPLYHYSSFDLFDCSAGGNLLCYALANRSVLMRSLSVQPAVVEPSPMTVVLQNIQHPGHLTEDQYSWVCFTETNTMFTEVPQTWPI